MAAAARSLQVCTELPRHAACLSASVQVSGSKRLVSRMAAPEPNPACMVCGRAQAHLAVNTQAMTLQQLVTKASMAQHSMPGDSGGSIWGGATAPPLCRPLSPQGHARVANGHSCAHWQAGPSPLPCLATPPACPRTCRRCSRGGWRCLLPSSPAATSDTRRETTWMRRRCAVHAVHAAVAGPARRVQNGALPGSCLAPIRSTICSTSPQAVRPVPC